MQFRDLDKDPQTGGKPISTALMVLYSLVHGNAVTWAPGQLEAVTLILEAARAAMTTNVTVKPKPEGGYILEFVQLIPDPSPTPADTRH